MKIIFINIFIVFTTLISYSQEFIELKWEADDGTSFKALYDLENDEIRVGYNLKGNYNIANYYCKKRPITETTVTGKINEKSIKKIESGFNLECESPYLISGNNLHKYVSNDFYI